SAAASADISSQGFGGAGAHGYEPRSALAVDQEEVLTGIPVLELHPRQLPEARPGVEHHPQDGFVAEVIEGPALARRYESADVVKVDDFGAVVALRRPVSVGEGVGCVLL